MQDERGLKIILSVPWIYELFQYLIGAGKSKRWLAKNYWKLTGQAKVVDIGCGTGAAFGFLPDGVEYVGFDISDSSIRAAQRRFGKKGIFIVGTARDFLERPDHRLRDADLVMCNGLLHHLDDREVVEVLQLSKEVMKPTGRLVCVENTFLVHQGSLSRWIIERDRGINLRNEQEWKDLVSRVFGHYATNIAVGLIRIPYVHIIIECWKE